jgi:hypothetical protein
LHKYIFDFEKTIKSDRLQYQKANGIGNAKTFDGDEYVYYSYILEHCCPIKTLNEAEQYVQLH